MNQCFAPTSLYLTFETEGQGRFTQEEVQQIVERDPTGSVVTLNLPSKSVIISNHQVYCDWWYVWCLTYFMRVHRDVFIVLKKSLKWVPILGPGMQMYRFIFLARSWASDQAQLAKKLSKLGKKAEEEDKPFAFMLFPEGTLVSKDTRPISKKYADKLGIPDLDNVLLPRATGLHYSLRSLAPRISGLKLLDITIIYPGVPPRGYGQSYYTLRSIFCDRVPPPMVHMHLRLFDVARDVPIGNISNSNTSAIVNGTWNPTPDIPESERVNFDRWLRELWTSKDQYITRFLEGDAQVVKQKSVEIPLELRDTVEVAGAYCFFAPAIATYIWAMLTKALF
ncbi:hypothetical protein ID866_1522 [Astraeus odoratus]|nr:hypothetical protein ID866_1522 [Astraeus odoratus]